MRRLIVILIIVITAVTWWLEKTRTTQLESRIEALAPAERIREALTAEQQRLRSLLPSDPERKKLLAASAEAADLEKRIGAAKPIHANSIAMAAIGEWSPESSWQNRGTGTPRDTIETALWAATGGDIAQFAQLLVLSPEIKAQVDALIARLPTDAQAQFSSPEAFIAAFTIRSIPVGPAQVVWSQQSNPDDATLCVFIRNPSVAAVPISIVPAHVEDASDAAPTMTREQAIALARKKAEERKKSNSVPPMIRPPGPTTFAYLAVHHTDAGWRLVVPDSAINKISRELTAPAPAP